MIRSFFDWLERWMMDDPNTLISMGKGLLVFGIAIALIIAPLILWLDGENETAIKNCLDNGGAWVALGERRGMRPVLVGKVTVMQPYTYTDYGCVARGSQP